MGDIMGDLNKKRGRIMGMDSAGGGKQRVLAEAPLAKCSSMPPNSMTQARGEFTMEFVRYEEAPMIITAEKVIAAAQKEKNNRAKLKERRGEIPPFFLR